MNDLQNRIAPQLGSRIRALRHYHGLNLRGVSTFLCCTRSAVSEFENAVSMLTVPRLVQYAWHLGVKPETVLRGIAEPGMMLEVLGKPGCERVPSGIVADLFRWADEPGSQGPNVIFPSALRKDYVAQNHPHAEVVG